MEEKLTEKWKNTEEKIGGKDDKFHTKNIRTIKIGETKQRKFIY